MEKLEYTVRQTICRYHMLQPGDQVVIALSGGADSVCLLSLLADMREEMGTETEESSCPSRTAGRRSGP